jgi:hypothetical protein
MIRSPADCLLPGFGTDMLSSQDSGTFIEY